MNEGIASMESAMEDILTLEEVANYLRVSEGTVYEWAQKGEIPAGKIGTVWRFRKSDIEQWVGERLPQDKLMEPSAPVRVDTILSPRRIVFLDTESKRDALTILVDNLSGAPQIKNRAELASELFKREDLMSTAIGRGIAIPHVRLHSVTDMVVSVGINKQGITDFLPLDDEPVRLILMIAAGYNQHAQYLQTLSFFSARLKNPAVRASLLDAKDSGSACEILCGQPS
jgi:PTS system nitrogen regulatory IIA component